MTIRRWSGWLTMVALSAGTARAQTVGSVSLGPMAGVQVRGADREAVVGGSARFGFEAGRWFLGPEFSVVRGARTRTTGIGLVIRFSGRGERVRPFAVGGAGSYRWSTRYQYLLPNGQAIEDWSGVDYFSVSFGGGVELGTQGRLNPLLEVRYHGNIQRDDIVTGGRGLVTAGVGLRYRW